MLAYFVAALLSGYLAERLRRSEWDLARKVVDYEELERLNSAIVANLDSGLMTVNNQGRVRVINRYAADLSGTTQEDAYDAELAEIMPFFSGIMLGKGSHSREELSCSAPDGSMQIYGYKVVPLFDSVGEREGFIINFKDLTSIKVLEERLKRSDKLAAIGELAARIAHEIRNPLAAISGSVQLIAGGDRVDTADLKLFQIVLREAERLNGLVTDFLSYAKPNQPNPRIVEVATFLGEFAVIARQDKRLHSLNIVIDCQSSVQGYFDPGLMQQALWNLVLNACDAITEQGEIRLTASAAKEEGGGQGGTLLEITDTGGGIAAEHLSHLFEPFYTTKHGGTGLGLATVYRIIDAHQGKIDVTSAHGKTTFSVWLPLQKFDKE
jgi:two-component system sensor histidine kinase PilS (NtrC family)